MQRSTAWAISPVDQIIVFYKEQFLAKIQKIWSIIWNNGEILSVHLPAWVWEYKLLICLSESRRDDCDINFSSESEEKTSISSTSAPKSKRPSLLQQDSVDQNSGFGIAEWNVIKLRVWIRRKKNTQIVCMIMPHSYLNQTEIPGCLTRVHRHES